MKFDLQVRMRVHFYRQHLGLPFRKIAELESMSTSSASRIFNSLRLVSDDTLIQCELSVCKLTSVKIVSQEQSLMEHAVLIASVNHLTGYLAIGVYFKNHRQGRYETIADCLISSGARHTSMVDVSGVVSTKAERAQKLMLDDVAEQLGLNVSHERFCSPLSQERLVALGKLIKALPRVFETKREVELSVSSIEISLNSTSCLLGFSALEAHRAFLDICSVQSAVLEYSFVDIASVKVGEDSHVHYEGAYYSVPHIYISDVVTLKCKGGQISIWSGSKILARHEKSQVRYQFVTERRHMPKYHLGRQTNPVVLISKANGIGVYVGLLVKQWLEADEYVEHVYRRFLALQAICRAYTRKQVNSACRSIIARHDYKLRALRRELEVISSQP